MAAAQVGVVQDIQAQCDQAETTIYVIASEFDENSKLLATLVQIPGVMNRTRNRTVVALKPHNQKILENVEWLQGTCITNNNNCLARIDASIEYFATCKKVYLKHITYFDNANKFSTGTDEKILEDFCLMIKNTPDANDITTIFNSVAPGGTRQEIATALRNYHTYMNGADTPVDSQALSMLFSWIRCVQEIEFAQACMTETVTVILEMINEKIDKMPQADSYIKAAEEMSGKINHNTIAIQAAVLAIKNGIDQLSVEITQFFALV